MVGGLAMGGGREEAERDENLVIKKESMKMEQE